MTLTGEVLWQADDQGRNWLRWLSRATVTALLAGAGLLAAVAGWPVQGYVLAGCAVLVALLGFGYWWGDRRKVVEIRPVGGAAPTLLLRTVTGRVDQVAVGDVTAIHVISKVWPYDPDIEYRSRDLTLILDVRGGARRYRCRKAGSFAVESPAEAGKDHWQRLFPRARVSSEVRFVTPGTGD